MIKHNEMWTIRECEAARTKYPAHPEGMGYLKNVRHDMAPIDFEFTLNPAV